MDYKMQEDWDWWEETETAEQGPTWARPFEIIGQGVMVII